MISSIPLTHVYFYAGNATREGVYVDSVLRAMQLFLTLFNPLHVPRKTMAGDFRKFEFQLEDKCVVLEEITDKDFFPESWNPQTTLVWLPGAEASSLQNQIGHKVLALRTFWQQGGKVVCVCGSAYWQSAMRVYGTFVKLMPCSLFSGNSVGPLQSGTYNLRWKGTAERMSARVVQGGYFVVHQEATEVLASYGNGEAAIVKETSALGGTVILSHPHIEYETQTNDNIRLFLKIIQELYKSHEDFLQYSLRTSQNL